MRYLLHLDDYHLDDLLFMQALGRFMAGAKRSVVLVHGGGGGPERVLEARGCFPEKRDGRYVTLTAEEAALVEQGIRLTNRALVTKLTDSLVPAVGLQGGDRGLLRRDSEGRVVAGNVAWLQRMLDAGAVPVVSAVVAGDTGAEPVGAGDAMTALAQAFAPEPIALVVLTRTERAGLGTTPVAEMRADALENHRDELADAAVAAQLATGAWPVLVTTAPAFFAPSGPSGTQIVTGIAD